jgi:RNA polymerase sigma-70 factor (ECF subfamily)
MREGRFMGRDVADLARAADADLIRLARAGEERALRELVGRYLRPALAVAWELVGSQQDAEDVVQEAFRRCVQALDRFDARREFRPWFFTILRNVARNHRSAGALRLHEALDESIADAEPSPLEQVEGRELQARADLALSDLPDMQRACFRLCVLEGLSSVEVAEALGIGDVTVRTHVYRARRSMRDAMKAFVPTQEES